MDQLLNQEMLNYSLYASIAIFLILVWTLPWKGVALWKSAKNKQLGWFLVLFLVNTLAILEIIYLAFFQKKENT